jgi:hypothetical protein
MKAKHLKALHWAVREAESWRGSMIGNPDTGPLEAFNAQIKLCKEALKEARLMVKQLQEERSTKHV